MNNTIQVQASEMIDARPEAVYALLSDYKVGHPAILPKPYFTGLTVEKGGQGEGTIVITRLKVMGQEFVYRQAVTEPEPGRVLVETDTETGQFSSFTFEPVNGGKQTHLTIYSEFPDKAGFAGWMERLMQPLIVGRIYRQELRNIAAYFQSDPHLKSLHIA
jgi:hypothetical protein